MRMLVHARPHSIGLAQTNGVATTTYYAPKVGIFGKSRFNKCYGAIVADGGTIWR